MSPTENIIVMSEMPTYDEVSPEATVETITFGTPYGRARITAVHAAVPCSPPSPITPWTSPRPMRCSSSFVAPADITGCAASRDLPAFRAASAVPPARATWARVRSARVAGVLITPMSTRSARLPSASSCSRRNSASCPFVSSVARTAMTFFGIVAPLPVVGKRSAWNSFAAAETARSIGRRSVDEPVQKPSQLV